MSCSMQPERFPDVTAPDAVKPVCPKCGGPTRPHCDTLGTGAQCSWIVCAAEAIVVRSSDGHIMGTGYYGS